MQPCLLCSLPQSYPAATCCREPPSGSPPSLSTVIEGFDACTQGLMWLAAAPSGLHFAERLLLCLPVALGQHKPMRRHCYIFLRVGCSPSAALPLSVHVSSTSASCDCDLPAALELSGLQQLTSGCTCQAAEGLSQHRELLSTNLPQHVLCSAHVCPACSPGAAPSAAADIGLHVSAAVVTQRHRPQSARARLQTGVLQPQAEPNSQQRLAPAAGTSTSAPAAGGSATAAADSAAGVTSACAVRSNKALMEVATQPPARIRVTSCRRAELQHLHQQQNQSSKLSSSCRRVSP